MPSKSFVDMHDLGLPRAEPLPSSLTVSITRTCEPKCLTGVLYWVQATIKGCPALANAEDRLSPHSNLRYSMRYSTRIEVRENFLFRQLEMDVIQFHFCHA